jgi:hypothetical protein
MLVRDDISVWMQHAGSESMNFSLLFLQKGNELAISIIVISVGCEFLFLILGTKSMIRVPI